MILLEQYERIFKKAYEKNQEDVTREVLMSINRILRNACKGIDNHEIIKPFCESGIYGPFLQKIQQIISEDSRDHVEKHYFASDILQFTSTFHGPTKLQLEYVELFVPNCIFEIFKIIIDNEDYDSFEALIEQSTLLGFFDEPGKLANKINQDITFRDYETPQDTAKAYELGYLIEIQGLRNYSSLTKFQDKLNNFSKVLKTSSSLFSTNFYDLDSIKKNTFHVYVSSLIYETFFWVGAYLIYKGKTHERFLDKFWNIANPKEGHVNFLNKPPVPLDLMWSVGVLFSHEFDEGFTRPKFGKYQSVMPYFYKFFGLLLLNSSEGIHFPSKRELEPFFEKDEQRILPKLAGFCSRLRSQDFIEFNKNLFELVDVAKILRKDVSTEELQDRITKLQDKAKDFQDMIMASSKMEEEKIKETISSTEENYEKNSMMNKLTEIAVSESKIPYTKQLSINFEISKDAFQDNSSVTNFIQVHGLVSQLFNFEEKLFSDKLNMISENIIKVNYDEIISQIHDNYNELAINKNPKYLLMNYELFLQLMRKKILNTGSQIKIGDDLLNVHYLRNITSDEFYLIDKTCIQTKYQRLNNERFGMSIQPDPNNPKQAVMNLQMICKCEIINNSGIRKFILSE